MVVEEESAGDVEGDEDVNAVVLMGGKDEEDAEAVEQPGKRVQEVDPTTRVLRDEEVQQGQGHCVAREHVVPARPHTCSGKVGSVSQSDLSHVLPCRESPAPDQMIKASCSLLAQLPYGRGLDIC